MDQFPTRAKVNRIVAKENFYAHIPSATKREFQESISRIIWQYKLSPETINLPAKKWPEMEVFQIILKNDLIPHKALAVIDSSIPYPILFVIEKNTIKKALICYKEVSAKNDNSVVLNTYFETNWNDPKINELKISGLSIDSMYHHFVRQIAGEKLAKKSTNDHQKPTLKTEIENLKEHQKIQKQIDALTRKISNEPSIGKKQLLAEKRYELKQLLQNKIS